MIWGCKYGKIFHKLNSFLSEKMVVKIEVMQIKERFHTETFSFA